MTLQSFLTQVGTLLVILILGLLALRWMNRPPSEVGVARSTTDPPPVARLPVDEGWTPEQCAEVFETLMYGQELHFFAADVASPSDPGGYVTAARTSAGNLTRTVGNHGWHSALREVSLSELQDELYRNRAAQTQVYRVEKAQTR